MDSRPCTLQIRHVATAADAKNAADTGFCPIECSFGAESVVDALSMDHHGSLAHLESVALRAWRDHPGARRDDPRFVVTGAADADATFAIAALAGLLPTGKDHRSLAELIAAADVGPVPLSDNPNPAAPLLLLWKQLAGGVQDALAFYAGVERWRTLLRNPPQALLEAALTQESTRVALARAAQSRAHRFGEEIALVESPVWGFDVWFSELASVIVAYVAEAQRVTVGVRDVETAQRFFGPRGLLDIFPRLEPPGWGGRETVGGSPRGLSLSAAHAEACAKALLAALGGSPNCGTELI